MIEKDISNLSREKLIQKYTNMKTFIITTGLADGMSEEHIRKHYKMDMEKQPITFCVETDIKIKALNCKIYRNENKQILMIESEDFVVIS